MKSFDFSKYIANNPLLKEEETDYKNEVKEILGIGNDECVKISVKQVVDQESTTFVLTVLQNNECPENYIVNNYDIDDMIRRANTTKIVLSLYNDREAIMSDAKPNNGGGITWILKYK